MQTPRKHKWAESILSKLSRSALLRHLDEVYLRSDETPSHGEGIPTIFYANHVCFWDSHLAILVTREFGHDFYLMIANRVMQLFPFLSWIGCFEVDRSDPFAVFRSIKSAAEILKQKPNCGMWIFPQGTHMRGDHRPLGFQPGLAQIIARNEGICLIPVAIRYEMLRFRKPSAFVSIGRPKVIENGKQIQPQRLTQELEDTLTQELDNLTKDLLAGRGLFQPILRRDKNALLCRGRKFYRKEIETALRQIEGVKTATVAGVKHPLYGDAIEAHIVRNKGANLDECVIKQRCRQLFLVDGLADLVLPAARIALHDELSQPFDSPRDFLAAVINRFPTFRR